MVLAVGSYVSKMGRVTRKREVYVKDLERIFPSRRVSFMVLGFELRTCAC